MAEKTCVCKIHGKAGEMEIPEAVEEQLKKTGGLSMIEKGLPNDKTLKAEARIFKALSDPTRIKILHLLNQQDLCVCLLKEFIDMSDSKLSYHINILKENGLITGERGGNFIIYHLTDKGREFIS